MTDRNASDVVATPVLRIPGMLEVNESLLACEHCGVVPSSDDNRPALQLNLVRSPDRDVPIFLGPNCTRGEVIRYLNDKTVGVST